jgi:hypothetical protein
MSTIESQIAEFRPWNLATSPFHSLWNLATSPFHSLTSPFHSLWNLATSPFHSPA